MVAKQVNFHVYACTQTMMQSCIMHAWHVCYCSIMRSMNFTESDGETYLHGSMGTAPPALLESSIAGSPPTLDSGSAFSALFRL